MRLYIGFALAVVLLASLTHASGESQTLTKRYSLEMAGLDGVGCHLEGDDYVGDAACWTLDGTPSTATLTLADDLLGAIPAIAWISIQPNEERISFFCEETTVALPERSYFLFVGPDPQIPPRALCGLGAGMHTEGTVTFTRSSP